MNDSFVVVYRTRRNQYDAAGALARSRRSRSVLPRGYTDPPTNRDRHTCSPQYSAHLLVRSKIVLNVPNHRVYCCSLNATVGRGMSNAIRLSIWLNSTSSVVLGAEERDVSAATHLLCLLRLSRCRQRLPTVESDLQSAANIGLLRIRRQAQDRCRWRQFVKTAQRWTDMGLVHLWVGLGSVWLGPANLIHVHL